MLTIYGVPISVHTRKVIVTAVAKGVDFRNEPVIPFDPPADWRRLSPTGLIPAISDDGFTLADSAAICAYLDRVHPAPAIYPKDARALGRALWFEQYATGTLFRDLVHPLFAQKIIRPFILKAGDPDQREIDRVLTETAPTIFGYLEGEIAGGYLVDDAFGIADIAVACNLINYRYLGFTIDAARHPKLARYADRVLEHKAFRAALAAEAPFAAQMGLSTDFIERLKAIA